VANKLPFGAQRVKERLGKIPCYIVEADVFYPALLQELKDHLGTAGPNPKKPTQYWLEVAYQCMKMDMQAACGFQIEIQITNASGKKWALIKHPDPDHKVDKETGIVIMTGVYKATKGLEAKRHYKALRGFIPS